MAFKKVHYTDGDTVIGAKNMNDIQDAIIELETIADGITVSNEASGEVIAITDSMKRSFESFIIYGKTTQDGTPAPDAPVELVSVGESGSVDVIVRGKNIADIYGFSANSLDNPSGARYVSNSYGTTISTTDAGSSITVTQSKYPDSSMPHNFTNGFFNICFYNELKASDQVTISFDVNVTGNLSGNNTIGFAPNGLSVQTATITSGRFKATIPWKTSGDKRYLEVRVSGKSMVISNIQIEIGDNATEYEPHEKQTLNVSTPNGLHGISVYSGGNYTDANGQQWVCDEVDLTRGVKVQRLYQETYNGSEPWKQDTNGMIYIDRTTMGCVPKSATQGLMCSHFRRAANPGVAMGNTYGITLYSDDFNDLASWKAWLAQNPITVLYERETLVETSLSEEEIAAYAALHTYRDNTTVSNDGSAYMELEYIMDARKYIDSVLSQVQGSAGRIANVSLPASGWKGSGSLYSQVVPMTGLTEKSQVNLTPSVEQLSVFYEKDIAFTTENDGGKLTVYVIGQKPTNDYVIPANIVEVIV